MLKLMFIGNLGGDPELRYLPDGTAVCNFSVAVSERWGSGENRQEKTTWFRVACWRAQAENAHRYLKKGSKVFVSGSVSLNLYTKADGSSGGSLEVNAREIEYLSRIAGENDDPGFAPPEDTSYDF